MNATERTALADGVSSFDEISELVGERTLEILNMRRKTAVIRRRGWLVRRMLAVADLIGLTAAFVLVEALTWPPGAGNELGWMLEGILFATTLPLWIVVAKLYGLYEHDEERADHSTVDEIVGVFHLITVGVWLLYVMAAITNVVSPDLGKLVGFWLFAIALVVLGRSSARAFCRRRIAYQQNTVIVGAGDVGQILARKFIDHPEYGINLLGFVDDAPRERREDLEDLTVLGPPRLLPAIVRMFDVERVVVAFSNQRHEETLATIRSLKDLDVQIDLVPRLYESIGLRHAVHWVEGVPLIGLPPLHPGRSVLLLKRVLDVAVSAVALVLLAPVFSYLALRIKLDSRGPVFYRDERIGRNGRRFRVFKFRTMRAEAESELPSLLEATQRQAEFERTHKLRDDPRVTRFGRFLRRTSLDELPQLLNVLRGDLSLVGPRAVTAYEYDRYGDGNGAVAGLPPWLRGYWQIDGLRPGMTGYWQITGRSAMGYDERVRLDMAYVASFSLRLDLKILAKTLRTLGAPRGAF